MVSLPTSVPNPSGDYKERTLVQDKFSYALNSDETTWDTWKAATENTVEYNVGAGATTNATKFSYFVM